MIVRLRRIAFRIPVQVALLLFVIQIGASIVLFNAGPPAILQAMAGEDILDNRAGYGVAEVERIFERYGSEGRALYARFLVWFDPLYGLISALAIGSILAVIGRSSRRLLRFLDWFLILPVAILFLDLLENVLLYAALNLYPNIEDLIAGAGPVTTFKFVLVNFAFVLILVGALTLGWERLLRRRRRTS